MEREDLGYRLVLSRQSTIGRVRTETWVAGEREDARAAGYREGASAELVPVWIGLAGACYLEQEVGESATDDHYTLLST